ncbi:hypothetical protein H8E77_15540 [bacterium]|nr:hypothetical protein [bacterium]
MPKKDKFLQRSSRNNVLKENSTRRFYFAGAWALLSECRLYQISLLSNLPENYTLEK